MAVFFARVLPPFVFAKPDAFAKLPESAHV